MVKKKRDLAWVWTTAKPSVRVGKGGVDEGLVAEVKRQLKKQRMIKVRVLRSALTSESFETIITDLATKTASEVCDRRGLVVVLARMKR